MTVDVAAVAKASASYPKPSDFKPSYGTAGFRADAALLASSVFGCGLLIGLRALSKGQVRIQLTIAVYPESTPVHSSSSLSTVGLLLSAGMLSV